MISNLVILATTAWAAVCVGELTHSVWWGGLVVVPVGLYAGFVNAPADDSPMTAETRKSPG